jgi:hypothetical protein
MNKRLAGRIILLSGFLITLFGMQGILTAQDAAPESIPAFLMDTADGIVFYGVNLENEVVEIGRLPHGFATFDPEQPVSEWRINKRGNFILSPDRQHIAFVAKTADSNLTGLFIYNVETAELNEAVRIEACGEFYSPAINWSPDSKLIAVSPGCSSMTGDSRILYRLADQTRLSLPDDYRWGYWADDNSTLLYLADGYSVKTFNPEHNSTIPLANIENLTISPNAGRFVRACGFVWSDYAQRWFFEIGCVASIDGPMDYLYSLDSDGNTRLEISLPDFYSGLFPQNVSDNNYQFINLYSIVATPSTLYLIVELGLYPNHWSILAYASETDVLARPVEVFHSANSSSYRDSLADMAFSPDQSALAMVDFEGYIKIVGLPEGNLIGEIQGGVFDNVGATYQVNWLDDNRLIYTRTDGGIGIFYAAAAFDQPDIDFAAAFDGQAFVLR